MEKTNLSKTQPQIFRKTFKLVQDLKSTQNPYQNGLTRHFLPQKPLDNDKIADSNLKLYKTQTLVTENKLRIKHQPEQNTNYSFYNYRSISAKRDYQCHNNYLRPQLRSSGEIEKERKEQQIKNFAQNQIINTIVQNDRYLNDEKLIENLQKIKDLQLLQPKNVKVRIYTTKEKKHIINDYHRNNAGYSRGWAGRYYCR